MREDWPRSLRHAAAVVLFYTFLFCLFFSPVLFAGRLLTPGDALMQYLPSFRSSRQLWESNVGAGFPVAAEPSNQFFYPPSALASAFGLWNVHVVSAYVLAAAATHAYVLALTQSTTAALVSGVSFGMSGFLVAHLAHVHLIHAAAWLPIVLWACERLRQRRSRAWCAIVALGVALLALAGHPQILLYALILCAAYALVTAPGSASGSWWYRRSVAVASLIGLGMAAVQLLPTAELGSLSHRSALRFRGFVSFDLPIAALPQLAFPFLFGGGGGREYFGTWNLAETTGYLGFLPWAAALVAVAAGGRLVWFWVAVALVALLLAMADATPLAALTYRLPVYRLFRCPARHLMETTLAVSVLAGLAIAELQRRAGKGASVAQPAAAATLLAVFSLAALTIALYEPFEGGEPRAAAGAMASRTALVLPLLFAPLAATALVLFSRWPGRRTGALLLGVTALELASFGWSAEWRTDAPERDVVRMPAHLREYRRRLMPMRQRMVSFHGVGIDAAMPNLGWLWDVPHAAAYMALVVGRHNELIPFVGSASLYCDENRALDLFAARYLFVRNVSADGPPRSNACLGNPPRWKLIESGDGLVVHENLRALPRAWMVGQALAMEADAVRRAIEGSPLPYGGAFDPHRTALVEEPVNLRRSAGAAPGTVEIVADEGSSLELATRGESESFLVLADVHYPGWRASIDGEPARIHRTNYALRGVVVPAGEHRVRFDFRPWTVYAGLLISAASLAFLGWYRFR